jgi:hypothetical protein
LEAISRKKEVDEMTKTLTKEHGRLGVNKTGALFTMDGTFTNGYRQIIPGQGVFVSETYFDLAGMATEDKTLFFEGAAVQEISNVIASPGVAGSNCSIVDLMTTKPLRDTELTTYHTQANILRGTKLTFDQTIYGRVRFQNVDIDNAAGGVMITIFDNQTGSLEPTASDRIYCYRIVLFGTGNADGDYFSLGARYLLRATSKEEAEYQYLMRLKRSYELQNQPDRD